VLTSPAWTAAFGLAVGLVAAAGALAVIGGWLLDLTRDQLAGAAAPGAAGRAVGIDGAGLTWQLVAVTAPILVAAALATLVASAALARGLVIPRRTVSGAPASPDGPDLTGGLASGARAALLIAVAATFALTRAGDLAALAGQPAPTVARAVVALSLAGLAHLAVAAVAVSLLDVLVRHRRLAAALRMTARERTDERRRTSGDPSMRRRQRAADPRPVLTDATLIVVGADRAAAIRWQPGSAAPEVVATGAALIARQIVSAARHRSIPSFTDDDLARALTRRGPVAPAHQPAVAHLLAALGLQP